MTLIVSIHDLFALDEFFPLRLVVLVFLGLFSVVLYKMIRGSIENSKKEKILRR